MASRNEFSKPVYTAIVKRATVNGRLICEGCGLDITGKKFAVDHILADGLRDKSEKPKKLTAEDGQLLGQKCCHKPKTAEDVAKTSKADMQAKSSFGINSNFKRQYGKGQKIQSRQFDKSEKPSKIAMKKIDKNAVEQLSAIKRRGIYG